MHAMFRYWKLLTGKVRRTLDVLEMVYLTFKHQLVYYPASSTMTEAHVIKLKVLQDIFYTFGVFTVTDEEIIMSAEFVSLCPCVY